MNFLDYYKIFPYLQELFRRVLAESPFPSRKTYTDGFRCLACNATWILRGGARYLERIKEDWKEV
ncbi:MAG: hypothetical protein GF383_03800 [Candidatus Lokiarchaeota archaeon]|nr:hypothetical protein [Candidatus Lokiarchaeota archaeon]MBD3338824.1 hypothetical protein [Candidatus Lokiarchaeota archaeon]